MDLDNIIGIKDKVSDAEKVLHSALSEIFKTNGLYMKEDNIDLELFSTYIIKQHECSLLLQNTIETVNQVKKQFEQLYDNLLKTQYKKAQNNFYNNIR
jgi:adenosylmethionine-8-amino-7-oxononanoate aminotransferase